MRKLISYIVAFVIIIVFSLPQTWNVIYSYLPTNTQVSQLNFKSLFGDYSISIDGIETGIVNDKQSRIFTKIHSGERLVKIRRISEINDFYYLFEKKINFYSGTEVDIEWESGPSIDSSNGIIKYFREAKNSQGTELNFITFPSNSTVEINDNVNELKKLQLNDSQTYKVKVKNNESYETRDFQIKLNTAQKNLSHTIEIYLYRKPFIQEDI